MRNEQIIRFQGIPRDGSDSEFCNFYLNFDFLFELLIKFSSPVA